jgi:GT2 family glycosyltransferase
MAQPVCSLIIVNYNGVRHLHDCLTSLQHLTYPPEQLDLVMIENGSDTASLEYVRQAFPAVRAFANTANNFAKALNLGVSMAQGDYIGFLNNDVTVEPRWLEELVALLGVENTAGAAGGKILFNDGRINSVGHRHLPHFYFEDLGFNEEDQGQYNAVTQVEGLCWAAVLFRRACLEDVGDIDEDFVMYVEDVDYAMRCRARGWRLLYTPNAMAHHEFHGSSSSPNIPYYFCNRNRFLYVAKHAAEALPQAVTTSHFFTNRQYEQLFDCIPFMIKKLVDHHQAETVRKVLSELCAVLEPIYGSATIDRLLARLQVTLGHRKMSIGIYSPALHTMTDEQEYISMMASAIQDQFDLTWIIHQEVDLQRLGTRYGLDLHQCQQKIISPTLDAGQDAGPVDWRSMKQETVNRCYAISEESGNYDLFINTDMSQEIVPLSPLSIAICRSPDDLRVLPLSVKEYTFIFADSKQMIERLQNGWDLTRIYLLSPAMERRVLPAEKEKRILAPTDELCEQTPQLMTASDEGKSLQERAYQSSPCYTRTQFEGQLRSIFAALQREYATVWLPDPQEVGKIAFNVCISADPRIV